MKKLYPLLIALFIIPSLSFSQDLHKIALEKAEDIEEKVIEWRRHFHENPELSNREYKTGEKIAEHLKSLGLDVQTGVAHTGVVAILKGGKPGPVVGLRADIDALPVTERNDLPFKSEVVTEYNGQETGVMHACGHDTHIAIMMGVAEVFSEMKADIPGTIKFIFQPAEEGVPAGERGGAKMMVEEGVLKNPDVEAIFGLHINAGTTVGHIKYKTEGIMAASDRFTINIKGKQAHGSTPWASVDPIAVSAQIINSLQYIVSRNSELTKEAAVVTVGIMEAGNRFNIIPESAMLEGTIRTLDEGMRELIHEKIKLTATNIAEIAGATADVEIVENAPLTYNDIDLTNKMVSSLQKTVGEDKLHVMKAITGAEDFSYFQNEIPGLYFFIGGKPETEVEGQALGGHHTPDFYIDESGMLTGVKAFINLTLDYMNER
ncbi:N-acyl-L-amino acid amidohydrolase [Marivirga tractuosa]|uniref:Carboxypeptidase Ss1 n=1 Tax=Marivirga tractuosa (strain ATCC 23168 / DSM 4126 / NBRC 15989 / NCIMB 1408 / VKM B-1430 / H-43) TaxID=643867 RepID=E4TRX3_MARTH|nr:amidohydrolase [Marivirga tractuosa]ADR20724.1 carboxypeptidase Ss1 [Marivirga tractuosa DSM 4126]BDD14825.1 N-acyl-L-amino acid amidohydrolase [Marivirga tractuosa]